MARKKTRKIRRKKTRKKEDIFGLDIPKIEVPKIEIPSFDFGSTPRKTRKKSKKVDDTFGLGFDIPSLRSNFPEQKKINPNKIPKPKLVDILSKQLSTNQIFAQVNIDWQKSSLVRQNL